jgi:hypothetical protein
MPMCCAVWLKVVDHEDDIGWHWDKDYSLESSGINVHPHVATVTYLSGKCASMHWHGTYQFQ